MKGIADSALIVGVFFIFFSVMGLGIYVGINNQKEWELYKTAHACKVVAEISGSTAIGVGSGGNGGVAITIIPISGQTGWLCDDGVTYYK